MWSRYVFYYLIHIVKEVLTQLSISHISVFGLNKASNARGSDNFVQKLINGVQEPRILSYASFEKETIQSSSKDARVYNVVSGVKNNRHTNIL